MTDMHKIGRRTFLAGGAAALFSYLYYDVHAVRVTSYKIPVRELPRAFEGYTILQISDLHNKEFGTDQEELIELISSLKYDLVVVTGDLINKYNPDEKPIGDLLRSLVDKEVYFVPGNHEWWTGYTIRSLLEEAGVERLENRAVRIKRGNAGFWLVGVDDPYLGRADLTLAQADIDTSEPRILLAHAPGIFPQAVSSGVDLVLVGHTHGGQIRIPLVGAILAPGQGFFPKYDYGLFTEGRTRMIVNCGLGESGIPVRTFNRPEIVLATLYRE